MKHTIRLMFVSLSFLTTLSFCSDDTNITKKEDGNTSSPLPSTVKTSIITDKNVLNKLKGFNKSLSSDIILISGAIEREDDYILKIETKPSLKNPKSTVFIGFLNKKTHEIIIGSAFSEDGTGVGFPKNINTIKEGASFTIGEGKEHYYLVTDPECPFCVELEKNIHSKLRDDITLHVFLMPLQMHKSAPVMIEWIMEGKTDKERGERYKKVMIDRNKEYLMSRGDLNKPFSFSKKIAPLMIETMASIKELGASATPSLFNSKLIRVSDPLVLTKGHKEKE